LQSGARCVVLVPHQHIFQAVIAFQDQDGVLAAAASNAVTDLVSKIEGPQSASVDPALGGVLGSWAVTGRHQRELAEVARGVERIVRNELQLPIRTPHRESTSAPPLPQPQDRKTDHASNQQHNQQRCQ